MPRRTAEGWIEFGKQVCYPDETFVVCDHLSKMAFWIFADAIRKEAIAESLYEAASELRRKAPCWGMTDECFDGKHWHGCFAEIAARLVEGTITA